MKPTQEQVIAWARESGGYTAAPEAKGTLIYTSQASLDRFAALVAAAERQRLHDKFMQIHQSQQHSNNYWHFAARKIKEEA